jgi:hypothetical protein
MGVKISKTSSSCKTRTETVSKASKQASKASKQASKASKQASKQTSKRY